MKNFCTFSIVYKLTLWAFCAMYIIYGFLLLIIPYQVVGAAVVDPHVANSTAFLNECQMQGLDYMSLGALLFILSLNTNKKVNIAVLSVLAIIFLANSIFNIVLATNNAWDTGATIFAIVLFGVLTLVTLGSMIVVLLMKEKKKKNDDYHQATAE